MDYPDLAGDMAGYIIVDNGEPARADALIAAQGIQAYREPANMNGLADYTYLTYHENREMVERKQIGEPYSEGLTHIEGQLRKELLNCAKLYLVIEGIIEPRGSGVVLWNKNSGQWRARSVKSPYNSLMQWETSINDFGITIVHTTGLEATIEWLVGRYRQAQQVSHQTMSRIPKGFTERRTHDLRVQGLMGLAPGIGPVVAEKLLAKYGSILQAMLSLDFWYADGAINRPLGDKLRGFLRATASVEEL